MKFEWRHKAILQKTLSEFYKTDNFLENRNKLVNRISWKDGRHEDNKSIILQCTIFDFLNFCHMSTIQAERNIIKDFVNMSSEMKTEK